MNTTLTATKATRVDQNRTWEILHKDLFNVVQNTGIREQILNKTVLVKPGIERSFIEHFLGDSACH